LSRIDYPFLTRALAWIVALTFVGGTIVVILLTFAPLGSPPEPGEDFINNVLADFEFQRSLWPVELIGISLFIIGFLAVGALGPVLARWATADDARRTLVSSSFLAAGGFGAASQLVWLGARPAAISGELCECGLRAEEVMSRLMTMNIVGGIQTWLVSGAMLTAAIGLVTAAGLGRDAGMPAGWRWLSIATAAVALLGAVLPFFPVFPFDVLLVAIVAGILGPAWVLWLANRSRELMGGAAPAG
jgi:hypothetical protein